MTETDTDSGPDRAEDDQTRHDGAEARPARALQAQGRRRDLARVLPVAGVVMLASPLLDVAAGGGTVFGIPTGVLYVFGVWGALILGAALLARRLLGDAGNE